jgi:hypothetical protein
VRSGHGCDSCDITAAQFHARGGLRQVVDGDHILATLRLQDGALVLQKHPQNDLVDIAVVVGGQEVLLAVDQQAASLPLRQGAQLKLSTYDAATGQLTEIDADLHAVMPA